MAIDYDQLKAWPFGEIEHRYAAKDVMLYALGLGLGADPLDPGQLRFVYEDGLRVLPGFALQLGYPGFWPIDPKTGLDWKKVLNAEQGVEIMRPLPAQGPVIAHNRIDEIVDKGPGKGAILYTSRDIVDPASGELLARVTQTVLARGDGGFGGPVTQPRPQAPPLPDTPPTMAFEMKTLPQAALIFRLSGDYNPLHADPAIARAAGFERPLLHGAALFGIAAYAIVKQLCGSDPAQLRKLNVRLSAPVYPGETIRTEIWDGGDGTAVFRARVVERDVVALDRGSVSYGGASRVHSTNNPPNNRAGKTR